jgi:hypothetical protein
MSLPRQPGCELTPFDMNVPGIRCKAIVSKRVRRGRAKIMSPIAAKRFPPKPGEER